MTSDIAETLIHHKYKQLECMTMAHKGHYVNFKNMVEDKPRLRGQSGAEANWVHEQNQGMAGSGHGHGRGCWIAGRRGATGHK